MNLKSFILILTFILVRVIVSGQDLYSIFSAPFNTKDYDEFASVPYKDGLVFCSNRPQNLFIIRTDPEGKPLFDLYFTRRQSQKWEAPHLFARKLNSQRENEGPACFSNDLNTIYFTRGSDKEEIFTSRLTDQAWIPPTPFPFNDPDAKSAQPFLSADGTELFFASDRKGGYGGFDLYVSRLGRNKQWGKPQNLGPEINSSSDEKYPFLHNNGKIYFSSNRKSGMGGFDIYFSEQVNGKWGKPVLLPAPVNSAYNDIAFIADSTDRSGFFSSDRNNSRQLLDIFEYRMNFPILERKNVLSQKQNKYTYLFTEKNAFKNDTSSFLYEWDFGDGQKITGRNLQVKHSFPKPGDYLVQLNVIDTVTGQVLLNQAANIFPVRDIEQPYMECKDSADVNETMAFNAEKTYLPNKKIINYYWDFNDGSVAIGKEVKHCFEAPRTYRVLLGITYSGRNNQVQLEVRYKDILIRKKP